MEELQLFGAWPSPFSYRVIWALKLKGVTYDYIEEKLADKSARLLKYNPVHKKIPVLVHGGKPIAESNIILEYIEETWPENTLLPKDPYEKAQARFWIKFGEDKAITFFRYFMASEAEQGKAKEDCLEVLKTMENLALGDKKFFGGDSIGLVDLSYGWLSHWLGLMEEAAGVKLIESHIFPRLYRWIENFKFVPAIKENLPEHDPALAYLKSQREKFMSNKH